jgi:hypothetical protein
MQFRGYHLIRIDEHYKNYTKGVKQCRENANTAAKPTGARILRYGAVKSVMMQNVKPINAKIN